MQTFLPYASFTDSARALDKTRLGNQVKECAQILASLLGGAYLVIGEHKVKYSTGGYPAHPATLMWKGCERSLCLYASACIHELRCRRSRAMVIYESMFLEASNLLPNTGLPPWLGDERLHSSHRSQLKAKDPDHYRFGWTEPAGEIDYWWPTKHDGDVEAPAVIVERGPQAEE